MPVYLLYNCQLDDQHRNLNMNNKDHLVGQLTNDSGTLTKSATLILMSMILKRYQRASGMLVGPVIRLLYTK